MAVVTYFGLGKVCRRLIDTEDQDSVAPKAEHAGEGKAQNVSVASLMIRSGLFFLMVPCLTFGILREGINMWSPTLLVEKYHVSSVQAMLLSTCLPVIAALTVPFARFLLKKAGGRELMPAILCQALTVVTTLLLLLLGSWGPAVCIGLLALTTAMQGGTSVVTLAVYAYFGKFGKSGTMVGVANTATFAGSASVSFLMGWVSQHFGWDSALYIWIAAAVLGMSFTAAMYPRWMRFKAETRDDQ
jgi:OPA family glycerol-3-phosphate transporter-like MFS transporter